MNHGLAEKLTPKRFSLKNKQYANKVTQQGTFDKISGMREPNGQLESKLHHRWLEWVKRMQAIAQSGLTYTTCDFELERYQMLEALTLEILEQQTPHDYQSLTELFQHEQGYATPKVDVRGVVLRGESILLVQEKVDKKWAIPGGWADVGLTPKEIAVKEVFEESGLDVTADRLLAVMDKRDHDHPPSPFYIYKIFIACTEVGGNLKAGTETLAADFFNLDQLPPLSEHRNTQQQIEEIFRLYRDPNLPAYCD